MADFRIEFMLSQNMNNEIEFIAAQGPKKNTVNEFWKMVWDHKTLSIVMVTQWIERGMLFFIIYIFSMK